MDNYINNCLYIALQNGGLSDIKLNKMKLFVVNREVAMCKLKDICEKLNIYITIKRLDNHKQTYKYGDESNQHFPLGLINKHYFIKDYWKEHFKERCIYPSEFFDLGYEF